MEKQKLINEKDHSNIIFAWMNMEACEKLTQCKNFKGCNLYKPKYDYEYGILDMGNFFIRVFLCSEVKFDSFQFKGIK